MTVEQRLGGIEMQLSQMTTLVSELVNASLQQRENIDALISGMGHLMESATEFRVDMRELKKSIQQQGHNISTLGQEISQLRATVERQAESSGQNIAILGATLGQEISQLRATAERQAEVAERQQQMIEQIIQARQ